MEETTIVPGKADSDAKRKQGRRQWSDLPVELLGLILSNLFAGDRFAFLLVCRSWQLVSVINVRRHSFQDFPQLSSDQTPCLILPRNKLFHPLYNLSFNLDNTEGILCDAVIRASKYNWLLMTQGRRRIFFFNPFTKVRIDLPDKIIGAYGTTFSSPPTCSSCVVTCLKATDREITICRIKVGEDRWTEHEFDRNYLFDTKLLHCNPVMHKGRYYYLDMLGGFFIYDPDKNKCFWAVSSSKAIQELLSDPTCERYVMEHDGDVLAVFMACDGRWIEVYKLSSNDQEEGWQAINQLRDKALYVSRAGCFCESALVRGTGNKIYFPRFHDNNIMFYSLATKKYHTFNGGSYNNFLNSKTSLHTTWMKPMPGTMV